MIYDWGHNNIYAGEGGSYNIISNYFKYGPSTSESVKYRIANPWNKPPSIGFGKWYVDGNYVDGSVSVTKDNRSGVDLEKGTDDDKKRLFLNLPFGSVEIKKQSAEAAYQSVLKSAGATLPKRDTLDERIINDVKKRTGRLIDVQGGYTHGTDYEKTINAWPVLKSLPPPKDSDADGIPDEWEKKNGLNPNDASDASTYKLHKSYTNIEVYINSITSNK